MALSSAQVSAIASGIASNSGFSSAQQAAAAPFAGGGSSGGSTPQGYAYSTPFGAGGTAYRDASGNILSRTNAQGQNVPMNIAGIANQKIGSGNLGVPPITVPQGIDTTSNMKGFTDSLGIGLDQNGVAIETPEQAQNQEVALARKLQEQFFPQQESNVALQNRLIEQAGIANTLNEIKSIQSQIVSRNKEYQTRVLNNRDRLISTGTMGKAERRIQNEQAMEIGALTASAEALKGNVDMALSIIDRQQKAYEADLNNRQRQAEIAYNTVVSQLDKADQKKFQVQLALFNNELAKDKEFSKIKSDWATNAIQAGNAKAVPGIMAAKDLAGLSKFGNYGQSALEKAQLANVYSQIADRNNPSLKPATQAQLVTSGYASRVEQANNIINRLQPEVVKKGALRYMAESAAPSFLQSGLVQQEAQAERNFVNAILRQESGAAIAESEFSSAVKQYFPRPGDAPATLQQKSDNRQLALQNLARSSGNAYQPTIQTEQTSGKVIMSGSTKSGLNYQVIQ